MCSATDVFMSFMMILKVPFLKVKQHLTKDIQTISRSFNHSGIEPRGNLFLIIFS